MKFSFSHKFNTDLDKFVELYFNEDCNNFLDNNLQIKERKLLKMKENKTTISSEYLVVPDRKIPDQIKSFIKNKISYIEKRVFHKNTNILCFEIIPGMFSDQIKCRGVCKLKQIKKKSIIREVEGELFVNLPLIGQLAEKLIYDEIIESFEKSTKFTKQYLNGSKTTKTK